MSTNNTFLAVFDILSDLGSQIVQAGLAGPRNEAEVLVQRLEELARRAPETYRLILDQYPAAVEPSGYTTEYERLAELLLATH